MDEFLHIVNHELHTPLTTLKSSVQLAQRRLRQIIQADSDAGQTASIFSPANRPSAPPIGVRIGANGHAREGTASSRLVSHSCSMPAS